MVPDAEQPIAATLTLPESARCRWDIDVIGAGPAGAVAARQLARHDFDVLLVDKLPFPRDKVCGCCVNAAALRVLRRAGLGSSTPLMGAADRQFVYGGVTARPARFRRHVVADRAVHP
jgi:flavin-dependent dehydrogenase